VRPKRLNIDACPGPNGAGHQEAAARGQGAAKGEIPRRLLEISRQLRPRFTVIGEAQGLAS